MTFPFYHHEFCNAISSIVCNNCAAGFLTKISPTIFAAWSYFKSENFQIRKFIFQGTDPLDSDVMEFYDVKVEYYFKCSIGCLSFGGNNILVSVVKQSMILALNIAQISLLKILISYGEFA
ncbi:hypothetical protein SUGI_0409540 [Cryptomeria japonica]|nr:hypothetical protein SUGI_0409540 [Cryptomeria japonica]